MILALGIIGPLILLAASAFFSASETALVSLSPQKSKRLALKNPELRTHLLDWIRRPDELLTLILFGNTFANVLFAASVTSLVIHLVKYFSPTVLEWITWAVETIVIVVVADMAPKFMARSNPEKTSMVVLPWLSRLRFILGPFFSILTFFEAFFPKMKTSTTGSVLTFSLDELKALLEEGQPGKGFSPDSVGMMQRVLDINKQTAAGIMVPIEKIDLIEIDPKGKPVRSRDLLLDLIVEEGHTRTPVVQKGEFIGFIHSDDLLPLVVKDDNEDLTKLVRQPMKFTKNETVSDLLNEFRSSGVYMGFVMDEQNKVVGIITVEDVLEEITGEILDEYDVSGPPVGQVIP